MMEVHEIGLSYLVEYENNPRNNDSAVEAVTASIKEFGFKVPIIVDKDNVIVAGHTRLKLRVCWALIRFRVSWPMISRRNR